jgi:G:T-mismatch repair DNA endonuclease (very short patch repair protein)
MAVGFRVLVVWQCQVDDRDQLEFMLRKLVKLHHGKRTTDRSPQA